MYLEERRQFEKALNFKAVGIPKQACYRCFLQDRVKIVNIQMVVLVCQEKKMDAALILLCRLSVQGSMLCFKTQTGTGKFKRIIDKFS